MKNLLKITKIIKNKNRIEYDYETTGKWNELLKLSEKMFVEYDINIEDVPNSIAIIPLMCNILPISWVFDIEISVDELDETFYNSLDDIKTGYQNMYPSIRMLGSLKVSKKEKNKYKAEKYGAFFSGGVDAFNTLLTNIEKKPTLMTVWGSDITVDNDNGWEIVSNHIKQVSKDFDLEHSFIKTNFRSIINYCELNSYINKFVAGEWWHEFQHGIGLIGLSAPLAYVNKFKIVYIASSFTEADKGKITCASDPTIDNYLKFASCITIHDGYEFSRQNKIQNIISWSDNNNESKIPLRVCWQSTTGKNCCKCEKCCRTMLGIMAEKKSPINFGFEINEIPSKTLMKNIQKNAKYDELGYIRNIRESLLKKYPISEIPVELHWLIDYKFKEVKPLYIKYYEKLKRKIKQFLS